jgi:hypothetical protein
MLIQPALGVKEMMHIRAAIAASATTISDTVYLYICDDF